MDSQFGKKQDEGFSLIEVMIAMVILSIGILGVANMQIRATNGTTSAAKVTRADAGLTGHTEELAKIVYDDPRLNATAHSPVQNDDGIDNDSDGEIDEAGETGHIRISYTVTQNKPIENCKRIDLMIRNGIGIGAKTLTVQYIKADTI